MKKAVFSLVAVTTIFTTTNAQIADSVAMGQGYANTVYYSLENGVVKTHPVNNWDIAFAVYNITASIRINDGQGAELYIAPYPPSDWNQPFDTAGLATWPRLYNGITSWEMGAFNQNGTPPFGFGWGTYNQVTKNFSGDRLFVLKTVDGQFKKIFIEALIFDTLYTFRYANLDNSDEVIVDFNKNDYRPAIDFIHYSISNNQFILNEPDKSEWDMVFTSYVANVMNLNYIVRGVLNNRPVTQNDQLIRGTRSVRVTEVTDHLDLNYTDYTMNLNISEIGFDWKRFNEQTFQWTLENWSFFVEVANGDVWQMWFTGFGGAGNGMFKFNKRKVGFLSIADASGSINNKVSLFPNPVGSTANLLFQNNKSAFVNLTIIDMMGKVVKSERINLNEGLQTVNIDVNNLNAGLYFIRLENGGKSEILKMVKN